MTSITSATALRAARIADTVPHVWRASQMASCRTTSHTTGYRQLDRELPEGGWPASTLIELLPQQAGIGEMALLQPALRSIAHDRCIALVQPPYPPQATAWTADDFPVTRLLWVKPRSSADALWAAEQILRNGTCGALLLWQSHMRPESLRRLHLAAQAADTVFWLLRPVSHAQDTSAAPLRLALRPAAGGIQLDIVKRRGPRRDVPIFIPLTYLPVARPTSLPTIHPTISEVEHALVDQRFSSAIAARNVSSTLG